MPQGIELHLHHRRDSRGHIQTETAEEPEGARPESGLEGKHQRDPRESQGKTTDDHRPEEDLLAGIELSGRHMSLAAEDAASLQKPDEVMTVGDVVPDPEHQHQQQAKGEGKRQVVVDILTRQGDGSESFGTYQRQQKIAAEHHVETGDGQKDEGGGGQPVRKAIETTEALDKNPRPAGIDPDTTAQQEEDGEQTHHPQKKPGAIGLERSITNGTP